MIAKVYSAIPQGYEGRIVEVEGDSNRGLPAFNIVGMANKTITESRERVRSALANSGFTFPPRKVTISLAPAELAKDGSHLDLPIALAILVLSEQLLEKNLTGRLFAGELALDGLIRPIRGIINIIETAKQAGYQEIYIPKDNLDEAVFVQDIKIYGVSNLLELFLHLKGQINLSPLSEKSVVKNNQTDNAPPYPTLDNIHGQMLAKHALAIAIAGHHNLLLTGPPGTGKSLLAQAAANLLPVPTPEEQLEIAKIHSLSNISNSPNYLRPFRAPHHTASPAALIGGGAHLYPGEISLAHRGILFLDELPEYSRNVIEALRQPLENHRITISRANQHTTYPANFILIATMNPCPCGYYGDPNHTCTCSLAQLQNYRKRISGPILDRIDMTVHVNRLKASEIPSASHVVKNTRTPTTDSTQENVAKNTQTDIKLPSEHNVVKNNITEAIQRQKDRYCRAGFYNSSLTPADIGKYVIIESAAKQFLNQACDRLNLSVRSYYKIIKVAQTITDLRGDTEVGVEHISEAISFRKIQNEH